MTNPAFPSATAIFSVNQEVLGGTSVPLLAPAPVTYSVSAANVAYCKVAIQFPDGIINVDGNGNIIGDSVEFTISVKPRSSGTWTQVDDIIINAKSDNPAVVQYQCNNPNLGSLWDIQIARTTQDNSTATRKNEMYLDTVEECQQINLSYNGIALLGLALDASTIGGQNASIPTMSVLVTPGAIPIPNNFNPATNTYTGVWNLSSFTTGVTDDPAWILTNLLTNAQYGGGIYGITSGMIDWGSFYLASQFNNQMVSDGNGGTQPRFTFNAPIQNRQDFLTSMNQVAQMMNANLGVVNGLITLYQDRPVDSLYLINKSRCVGSDTISQGGGANPVYFKYSSNMLSDRTTAVNVTWVNEYTVVAKHDYCNRPNIPSEVRIQRNGHLCIWCNDLRSGLPLCKVLVI
jgi:predicted phage tail protein